MDWESRIEDKIDKILEHQTQHEIRLNKLETEVSIIKTSLKWFGGLVSSVAGVVFSMFYDKLVK